MHIYKTDPIFGVGFFDVSLEKPSPKDMSKRMWPTGLAKGGKEMAVFTGAGVAIITPMKENLEVDYDEKSAHRADYDAFVLAEVWQSLLVILTKNNLHMKHFELQELKPKKELVNHLRP